jgi:hypothetical protein
MDNDGIHFFFVCVDVGSRERDVEWVREPAHQGPVRPLWGQPWAGERWQHEDV